MQKTKCYSLVRFDTSVIRDALKRFREASNISDESAFHVNIREVKLGERTEWGFDTDEEFFAARAGDHRDWRVQKGVGGFRIVLLGDYSSGESRVQVVAPKREDIEAVFAVFEEAVPRCTIQKDATEPRETRSPRVFIGHGRSEQWRDLKDHLHEKHEYDVEAYEVGARAGHAIRDILERMARSSDFALFVMTGEDEGAGGEVRARSNVIHETGLFQGRLGFDRAIVLLEEGTEEFSNLYGIHQIRYGKGNIKETFGEVLATLRREFGPQ